MGERYITVKESMKKMSIGRNFLYELIKKGEITPYKMAKRATRLKESEIDEYMERCKNECKD